MFGKVETTAANMPFFLKYRGQNSFSVETPFSIVSACYVVRRYVEPQRHSSARKSMSSLGRSFHGKT